jgi:hypothetical protein
LGAITASQDRPIADLHHGFLMLQCSPSLQTFVHLAAFIWLKRRCADKV